MTWLKNIGSGLVVAVLGFAAFMLAAKASRERASAKKWKAQAVADAESEVEDGIAKAKAALSQANVHDANARKIDKRTKARLNQIGGQGNATMADVVSSWRKPKRLRDDADT